jgi:ribosomal protein S27AE
MPVPERARSDSFRIKCPHCGAGAKLRTSKTLTPLYREIYYHCSNLFCGHTFMATHEIVRTVAPSRMPNPDISLPMLPAAAARAQSLMRPANDHDPPAQPKPLTG